MIDTKNSTGANRRISFEYRWLYSGGGPAEEIRTQFGMAPCEFFRQLLGDLEEPPAPLRPALVEAVSAVARRRLWLSA
jgi:hypothetical protein